MSDCEFFMLGKQAFVHFGNTKASLFYFAILWIIVEVNKAFISSIHLPYCAALQTFWQVAFDYKLTWLGVRTYKDVTLTYKGFFHQTTCIYLCVGKDGFLSLSLQEDCIGTVKKQIKNICLFELAVCQNLAAFPRANTRVEKLKNYILTRRNIIGTFEFCPLNRAWTFLVNHSGGLEALSWNSRCPLWLLCAEWNPSLTWHFTHTTHTNQSLCW